MHIYVFLFLMRSVIFHTDRRNNSSRCLLRRLPRHQDVSTPSKSTQHTCHLGGLPFQYEPGPNLLDFSDQMGTGISNVSRCRSSKSIISTGPASEYLATLSNSTNLAAAVVSSSSSSFFHLLLYFLVHLCCLLPSLRALV
jgi:hypothetical protein